GEEDDARGGQHRDVGRAGGGGGVALADDPFDAGRRTRLELHGRTIEAPGHRRRNGRPGAQFPPEEGIAVVEESVLQRVLGAALRSGGEFAEVYVEDRRNAGARLDDGKIEEFTAGRARGAGIRVVSGASTGYAHTSDLSERALTEAARAAGAAARGAGGRTTVVALERRDGAPTHPVRELPETVEKLRKAEVLRRADDAARSAGGAIRQVSAAYADARKRVLIANSDGLLVSDDRVRTRFMVSCTALGDGGLQSGFEGPGRTVGFELFDDFDPEE